jgi:hypothetical protein
VLRAMDKAIVGLWICHFSFLGIGFRSAKLHRYKTSQDREKPVEWQQNPPELHHQSPTQGLSEMGSASWILQMSSMTIGSCQIYHSLPPTCNRENIIRCEDCGFVIWMCPGHFLPPIACQMFQKILAGCSDFPTTCMGSYFASAVSIESRDLQSYLQKIVPL